MSDFKQLSRSVKGLTVLVTGAASGTAIHPLRKKPFAKGDGCPDQVRA